jgi:hypothetical protein
MNFAVMLCFRLDVTLPKVLCEKVHWHGVKIHVCTAINVLKLAECLVACVRVTNSSA